jgi:hypothetical protein
VARLWVDKGDIVLIADSQGVRDIYSADGNAMDATTPLAVLVNKGTASASEVRGKREGQEGHQRGARGHQGGARGAKRDGQEGHQ